MFVVFADILCRPALDSAQIAAPAQTPRRPV
jgi:hypothetical protein